MANLVQMLKTVQKLAEISKRTYEVARGYESFPSNLKEKINQILADQQVRVWDTKGGEIGASWGPYTLIDTGRLKSSMIDPGRIIVKGYGTTFSIESDVEYAKYVNERWGRIYGISATTKNQIEESIRTYVLTGRVE